MVDRLGSGQAAWPRWTGYAVAVVAEVLLTLALELLPPRFPLQDFPITHVLVIMAIAYVYGEGPAILAFLLGLLVFVGHIPIGHPAVPTEALGWARIVAFLMGTSVVGFAMVMIRRSQRRTAQLAAELDRQRVVTETFMESVPVGLALFDRDARHVLANAALARMGRLPLDRVRGKTVWEVLPQDVADSAAAAIRKVFATGEPVATRDLEATFDIQRYFDVDYMPVRVPEGGVIGVGMVAVETTEQVLARQHLERGYEREHMIAETLQTGLLGEVPRRLGCFEFETLYRAALDEARIGGDFYDVFQPREGRIGIVIGDVSGKGLRAAVQVALAKYSLRDRAYECGDLAVVMEQVNNTLVRDTDPESFVTVFAGLLDAESKTLTYSNGGHAPVILWKAARRRAILLHSTGMALGMVADAAYEELTVELQPGDELLLGTDGLFEAKCGDRFMVIDDLLRIYTETKLAGPSSAAELVERIAQYCGADFRDDIAVLRVSVLE